MPDTFDIVPVSLKFLDGFRVGVEDLFNLSSNEAFTCTKEVNTGHPTCPRKRRIKPELSDHQVWLTRQMSRAPQRQHGTEQQARRLHLEVSQHASIHAVQLP